MKKDNLILSIAVVVIIVIIAIIAIKFHSRSNSAQNNPPAANQQSSNNQINQQASSTPTSTPSSTGSTKAKKLSYGDALKTYKFRIQFVTCNGMPGTTAVAKGTSVMLDNRDNKSHIVKINGQSIKLGALDYSVYTSSVKGLFNVTCDGGGAAILNVE